MAKAKPPTLHLRKARSRVGERTPVSIAGTCRIGDRPEEHVVITELGPNGCRIRADSVGVTKTEPLMLTIGTTGPIPAQLKWAKSGALGVSFEPPLERAAIDDLLEASAPANDIAPLQPKKT